MRSDSEDLIKEVVKKVFIENQSGNTSSGSGKKLVPAEISGRHIHISRGDLDILFGSGYQLKKLKDLSQPNQFASEETVRLIGSKRVLEKVRILGPCRSHTQVEISKTDAFYIGIKPVIRISGDIEGTPGILIIGPCGFVSLSCGVIISKRHLHIESELASSWGLKANDLVRIRVSGERPLIFEEVLVRCGSAHKLALHFDTDEGNAANLKNGELVELLI
ncbi:phosphate propanoyltransferase [Candidatus Dependentiae bacterium]|nr:phosphate propanoyltransferase [Candidatus Dependentiae bacterium]